MVRCYSGDICGKFWYAVQGSADISNLLDVKEINIYKWHGCNCIINEPALVYKNFCGNCYQTPEQFLKDALPYMEDKYSKPYQIVNQIYYDLLADDHLSNLEVSLYRLRIVIHPEIIDEFNKIENDVAICNANSGIFNNMMKIFDKITETEPEKANPNYVSRYMLGLQIKYQLVNKGSCYVLCEL